MNAGHLCDVFGFFSAVLKTEVVIRRSSIAVSIFHSVHRLAPRHSD